MGSIGYKTDSRQNEQPRHRVNIKSFHLSRSPVSQAQWQAVMGGLPKIDENFRNPELPVVNIWGGHADEFCRRLSKIGGTHFRLPSEAEWEYACRAGTNSSYYYGSTITTEVCNFNNRLGRPSYSGEFHYANAFGLY